MIKLWFNLPDKCSFGDGVSEESRRAILRRTVSGSMVKGSITS